MADNSFDEEFTLSSFKGKNVVLFFYPLDFTFVCPSEIVSFDKKLAEFKERNCEVIGVSIDSQFSHHAWRKTALKDGGIGEIGFPLVADLNKQISADYGVLLNDSIALRGLFLIDKTGTVRHALVNDLPIGRSVDEALRVLDAMLFTDEHGEVCPANWQKGEASMVPTAGGVASYLAEHLSE